MKGGFWQTVKMPPSRHGDLAFGRPVPKQVIAMQRTPEQTPTHHKAALRAVVVYGLVEIPQLGKSGIEETLLPESRRCTLPDNCKLPFGIKNDPCSELLTLPIQCLPDPFNVPP